MGAVREWSAAICLAALAAALLQGLAPSGAMERMVKLVLGAFVLCALAMPLKNLGMQLSLIHIFFCVLKKFQGLDLFTRNEGLYHPDAELFRQTIDDHGCLLYTSRCV